MKMFLSLKQSELVTADLTVDKNTVISSAGGYTYDVMDGFKTQGVFEKNIARSIESMRKLNVGVISMDSNSSHYASLYDS